MVYSPINANGQVNNTSVQAVEICDNGIDDDNDGLVDRQDDDCPTSDEEQQKQSEEEQQKQSEEEQQKQQASEEEQQQPVEEEQQQQQQQPVEVEQQQQQQQPVEEEQQQQQTAGQEQQQTTGHGELHAQEVCANNTDDDADGVVDENCPTSTLTGQEQPKAQELCGNNIDDDLDGQVDENCTQIQNSPVEKVSSEVNSTKSLATEQVPPIINKCPDNDTSCTLSAEPKLIPPEVNECSDNQSGCNPSTKQVLIPPIVNQCQDNDSSCNPSAESKLIPPIAEPCVNNESGCFGVEPKGPLSTPSECQNNLTECNSEIEPGKSVEPIADISDCPNNQTVAYCLPPADVPIVTFKQNTPPVADAGEDQNVDEDSTVTLDGSGSHDGDGNITSYSWVQTNSGEPITILESDSPNPTLHVPGVAADLTLTFQLTVFDDMGYGTTDDVNVNVKNVDKSPPLPLNGSINLQPVPSVAKEGTPVLFKGQLQVDDLQDYDGRYIQIVDSSGKSDDILTFGTADKNGIFVAEWMPQSRNLDYNIYALYEGENGTTLKSDTYGVKVSPNQSSTLGMTDATSSSSTGVAIGPYDKFIKEPYIDLRFDNYDRNAINVYIINKDEQSRKYIPVAENAIKHWSQVLKDRSGNLDAWNFKFFTSTKFPNLNSEGLAQQRGLYPINILVNLFNDKDMKWCNQNIAGNAHINWLNRLFNSTIRTNVMTGCGGNDWFSSQNEQNKEIARITSHEFGHALGLGHTWHEFNDMMCSSDYSQKNILDRLRQVTIGGNPKEQGKSCTESVDVYRSDKNQPSLFDIRAILNLYKNDGFQQPNVFLIPGLNDYYKCRPLPCDSQNYSGGKGSEGIGVSSINVKNTEILPKKEIVTGAMKNSKLKTEQFSTENKVRVSPSLQTYSYNDLGISLKHPPDWKFVGLKNGFQLIKDPNVTYIEIRKSNSQVPNTTLEQLANHDIQERFSSRKDFRLLNLSQTTVSGNLPAYKAVYEFLKTQSQNDFTNAGDSNKVLRITTIAHGNAYIIKYVSEKNKYDAYLPIAEKIIDSLKFNANTIVVPNEVSNNNNNDNHKSSNNGNQKSDSLKKCYTVTEFNPPPCLERDNSITYSCNDDRHYKTKDERCMYWNKKTGDWDVRFTLTGNETTNNKNGKITVGYGDVGSYYGKGKVVIKNLDTGETLVTEDLNFANQHNNQGSNCCVKVYTFDDSGTHSGDTISAKVTGGGGSWESGPYKYENNLRMSITLDEIGEDIDGNKLIDCNGGENPPPCILGDNSIGYSCKDPRHFQSDGNQCLFWDKKHNGWGLKIDLPDYNGDKNNNDNNMTADDNNNSDDNHKKKDNSEDNICDSDPDTKAPSCDDFEKEFQGDNNNDNTKFEPTGNLSGG